MSPEGKFLNHVFEVCGNKSGPNMDVSLTEEQIAHAAREQAREFLGRAQSTKETIPEALGHATPVWEMYDAVRREYGKPILSL